MRAPAPHPTSRAAAAPARRSLAADAVQVWRASLDAPPECVVAALARLLSADEQARSRRFYFERERRRFVVGRGILRSLLGSYLGCAPEDVRFTYGANGKPALAGPAPAGGGTIYFNVAHSEDLALFAFTRAGEIGVDVERIRALADWPSIAELSFTAEELARLRACPERRRRDEFFHAWTRQEAVLKAAGTGLGGGERVASAAFRIFPLDAGPGFAAALAVGCAVAAPEFRSLVAAQGGGRPAVLELP